MAEDKIYEQLNQHSQDIAIMQESFIRHMEFEERDMRERTEHRKELAGRIEQLFQAISQGSNDLATCRLGLMAEIEAKYVDKEHLKIEVLEAALAHEKTFNGLHGAIDKKILDTHNIAMEAINHNKDAHNKLIWVSSGIILTIQAVIALVLIANKLGWI